MKHVFISLAALQIEWKESVETVKHGYYSWVCLERTIAPWLGLCKVIVFIGRVPLNWKAVGERKIRLWRRSCFKFTPGFHSRLLWLFFFFFECNSCSQTITAGACSYIHSFYLQTELLYCINLNANIKLCTKSASDYGFLFPLVSLVVLI